MMDNGTETADAAHLESIHDRLGSGADRRPDPPARDWNGVHPMIEHRGYTLEAQIACVRRELALRKGVYPKWVLSGRMKAEEADHQINCMQAVHDTLSALREGEGKGL
jgi:hypothetical protein